MRLSINGGVAFLPPMWLWLEFRRRRILKWLSHGYGRRGCFRSSRSTAGLALCPRRKLEGFRWVRCLLGG